MKVSAKTSGLRVVLILIILNVALILFDIKMTFSSPFLLAILNFGFQSLALFAIAYISAKSYLKSGLLQLLLIGCGLVSFGIGVIINLSRILLSLNRDWTDFTVTMHSLGLFIFSLLSFAAAILLLYKQPTHNLNPTKLKSNLGMAYFLMGILITSLSLLALYNVLPEFFSPQGFSVLGNSVQAITLALFIASTILFIHIYSESKSKVLYWYSLGLGLYAIGVISSITISAINTPLFWIGQITQYTGSVFFLIAIGNAKGEGRWTAAFKRNKVQFEYLFTHMIDGFAYHEIILDDDKKPVDYVFLEFNEAFTRMTGIGREAIGKRATEVLPGIEKDPSNWIQIYGKVAQTGEPARFENYSQSLKKWYSVSAYSPIKGYFVAVLEDVTERKQTQEKLEEYSKNLEALVDERTKQLKDSERLATIGQTAGAVGHDIRNPLQTITSELFLLKSSLEALPDSEEKRNAIESTSYIEEQTEYINDIITDLQDYAKKLEPRKTELDILQSIPQIIATLDVPERIQENTNIPQNFPPLMLDPTYFRRIITNLVTNAVHAMPKGGILTITAYTENDKATISIEDTGIGIPDELKQKIFQPLFTTRSRGHGFGLPVIKRLVEVQGGTITFESQEGKGTKFVIQFPLT